VVRVATWNPLAGNPLRTRADLVRAVHDLVDPLLPSFSPGDARVRLGHTGVIFPDAAEELEGFARPLWALVPLAAGGDAFPHAERWRAGLVAGSDPDHPEYWGAARREQRMVEMAAIGFGLCFAPQVLWDPLPEPARARLARWLDAINHHLPVENNWQFFRVLVNLGLARVGRGDAAAAQRESLDRIDRYALEDGWYQDGPGGHVDWYVPWALHAYGLLYAASGLGEPERAERFRERARRFAAHHAAWFDARGRGLPFGRSLTYRFAQSAFWAALVFADEEALPWGQVKGLLLRNLRAWSHAPIATRDGLLTLGYGYPNLRLAEPYSSSGSPYWALKAFLCLARPADHAFWRAEEEPLAEPMGPRVQRPARMALTRDATQVQAVSAGQTELLWAGGAARYAKLAYSSAFAFSVGGAESRPHHHVHDSMLALREEHGPWRVREAIEAWALDEDGVVFSRWRPWPDVEVETWLVGRCPWHWRLHRITSARTLHSCEAGFALGWDGLEPGLPGVEIETAEGAVALRTSRGAGVVAELDGGRDARMQPAPPNTNLMERRTVVPTLHGSHAPGTFLLACAVGASEHAETLSAQPPAPPAAFEALLGRLRAEAPPP
jgi:hypothetical protein